MTLSKIIIAGILRGEELQMRVRDTEYEFFHWGERDEEEGERFRSMHVSLMSWTNEYGTCVLRECLKKKPYSTAFMAFRKLFQSRNWEVHCVSRFIEGVVRGKLDIT
jgi:hypothetical protein